jgi:hypothetical protein
MTQKTQAIKPAFSLCIVWRTDIANKGVADMIGLETNLTTGGAICSVIGIAFHGIENAILIF